MRKTTLLILALTLAVISVVLLPKSKPVEEAAADECISVPKVCVIGSGSTPTEYRGSQVYTCGLTCNECCHWCVVNGYGKIVGNPSCWCVSYGNC
jgi:hypothetical protein